jgi:hypothetical protein
MRILTGITQKLKLGGLNDTLRPAPFSDAGYKRVVSLFMGVQLGKPRFCRFSHLSHLSHLGARQKFFVSFVSLV